MRFCIGGPMDGAVVPEEKVYNGILYSGIEVDVQRVFHGVFRMLETVWGFVDEDVDYWVEYRIVGDRAIYSQTVKH